MTGYNDSVSHNRLCECLRCRARTKLKRLMADPKASRSEIEKTRKYIGHHMWAKSVVVQREPKEDTA